jgi:hypothetical protein
MVGPIRPRGYTPPIRPEAPVAPKVEVRRPDVDFHSAPQVSAAQPPTSFQHVRELQLHIHGKIDSTLKEIDKHHTNIELRDFGLKIIDLYKRGLKDLEKIEPNVRNHTEFSQSIEHTVTSASKQKGKDPEVDRHLKRYNTAKRLPFLDHEKKYDDLRTSMQAFAKPQAETMTLAIMKDSYKSIDKAIKKACSTFLENQHDKKGVDFFSGHDLNFVRSIDAASAQNFFSKKLGIGFSEPADSVSLNKVAFEPASAPPKRTLLSTFNRLGELGLKSLRSEAKSMAPRNAIPAPRPDIQQSATGARTSAENGESARLGVRPPADKGRIGDMQARLADMLRPSRVEVRNEKDFDKLSKMPFDTGLSNQARLEASKEIAKRNAALTTPPASRYAVPYAPSSERNNDSIASNTVRRNSATGRTAETARVTPLALAIGIKERIDAIEDAHRRIPRTSPLNPFKTETAQQKQTRAEYAALNSPQALPIRKELDTVMGSLKQLTASQTLMQRELQFVNAQLARTPETADGMRTRRKTQLEKDLSLEKKYLDKAEQIYQLTATRLEKASGLKLGSATNASKIPQLPPLRLPSSSLGSLEQPVPKTEGRQPGERRSWVSTIQEEPSTTPSGRRKPPSFGR